MHNTHQRLMSCRAARWRTLLLAFCIFAACLLSHTVMAQTFPPTQCPASRYGDDLGCTANDVSITDIRVVGDITSCTGGSPVTLDLELTVNFASPDRWDIGVFISNDGKDPQLRPASGGAASCSVSILPLTSPFLDLDSNGGVDTCGDGNNSIGGGTGSGIHYMPGTTVSCRSIAGGGGNLYIPFVVSWDNQKTPPGAACTSIAHPVPNTKSKCNAPTVIQGSVSVVVMPTITNTDGFTFVSSGDIVTYTVTITNTTGVALSGAVFRDPLVTNIDVSSVTCSAAGATCPAVSVAAMQGAGITIPDMPVNGSVTFTITATLAGSPPDTLTNTASVTVGGQTKSVSDTDNVVGTIAIIPSSLSQNGTSPTTMVFNYTLYNFGTIDDTISLSALSNHGWAVGLSSPITVSSGISVNFTVTVVVPGGETVGTVDVTTITAISGNNPSKRAVATAVTTVSGPLTLTPNNTGAGGMGSFAVYAHRVQNNTAAPQTISFSTTPAGACAGWTSGIYKSDTVTQIPPATVTLAPFGGFEDIAVRVNIPATAVPGTTCTLTVTATAGGNSSVAVDTTTVGNLVLYSDPGYTDESYIFPVGNSVYARAFGTVATDYRFLWFDSNNALIRTSPNRTGPGTLPDAYDIPAGGALGTWRVEARRVDNNALFAQVFFFVGPDHLEASYTGASPVQANTNATINLELHDKNHLIPMGPSGLVRGNPPTTRDPLLITVTVSGAATIEGTTLTCTPSPCTLGGQTVTGRLDNATGTATITISDTVRETVTITPSSFNSALYGSPARDETTAVPFVIRRMRILYWRETH